MSYPGEIPDLPDVPPGEDELPSSDGEPMESELHRKGMSLLIESLDLAWRDRDDVYVGGNMFLYFSELQVKKNDFRGPDVFVVLDTVRRLRKSWVVWQEARTPDVVIELISASTERTDRGDKMRIYARALRVPEYFLFDPEKLALEGYALDAGSLTYQRMAAEPGQDLPSRPLGLRLGLRRGVYQGTEHDWLRWIDAQGKVLPTQEEVARQEAARADEEKRRADEEKRRADEEKRRADEVAAKLAEYERQFGRLP